MVKSREADQQREEVRAGELATSDGHHVLRSREPARGGCGLHINE